MPAATKKRLIVLLSILAAAAAIGAWWSASMESASGPAPSAVLLAAIAIVANLGLAILCARGRVDAVIVAVGGRRLSWRRCATDVAAALGMTASTYVVFAVASRMLGSFGDERLLSALLPRTPFELAMWMATSVVAGTCEELVFRDYLQHELAQRLRSRAGGVIGQATVFAMAHAYQGPKRVVLNGLVALLFGRLACWRGDLRANILAHTLIDVLAGATVFVAVR